MKVVSSKYLLQLSYNRIGEQVAHVCNKFSSANANKFMEHPDFIKLHGTGRLYYAQNLKGECWFLLLEPIGSSSRQLFAQIRKEIKISVEKGKLATRIDKHLQKAEALAFKAEMLGYTEPPRDLWEF